MKFGLSAIVTGLTLEGAVVLGAPVRFSLLPRDPTPKLVVFGDSLSDNGNGAWVYSNHTWPADPAYYEHHFSNGPVWAQQLAKQNHYQLHDLAAGGATSDNTVVQGFTGPKSTIPVPSTNEQIESYFKQNKAGDSDIFTLWVGVNDVFFNSNLTGYEIALVIGEQVSQLASKGAKRVMLASHPNIAKLPFAVTQTTDYQNLLSDFGTDLRTGLYEIASNHSQTLRIEVSDVYTAFNDVFANPAGYGLNASLIETPCLEGAYGESERSLCKNAEQYLWFDLYHPTRVGHYIIAQEFARKMKKLF